MESNRDADDDALLDRFASGDAIALEELLERETHWMLPHIRSRMPVVIGASAMRSSSVVIGHCRLAIGSS